MQSITITEILPLLSLPRNLGITITITLFEHFQNDTGTMHFPYTFYNNNKLETIHISRIIYFYWYKVYIFVLFDVYYTFL